MPEVVSRTTNCTRSSENYTKYIRLLFFTEKIILSNKLSKNKKELREGEAGGLVVNK